MKNWLRRNRGNLLAGLVLIAAAFLCHARYLLPTGLAFAADGDSFRQILPTSILLQQTWQSGDPFWSWSFGLGGDVLTELSYAGSVGIFNLLQALLRGIFDKGNVDLTAALSWKLAFSILKQALAMLLLYALVHKDGKKPVYAALGALVYGCAPWFLYRALLFDFMTDAMVFLPLTALCYQHYRRTGRWAALSLAVAVMLGNNFYFGYICVLFFALYFLVFAWEKGDTLKDYCLKVLKLLGICGVGAMVAAVTLLPSINGILSSDRTFSNMALPLLPSAQTLSEYFQLVFLGSGKLAVPLLSVLAVNISYKKLPPDEKKRSLLAGIWLILLLFPGVAGIMNGFSYPTPRWHFIVIFAVAAALPDWLCALEEQTPVKPWQTALSCGVLIGLAVAFGQIQASLSGAVWILSFLLELAALLMVGCRPALAGWGAKRLAGKISGSVHFLSSTPKKTAEQALTILVVFCVGVSCVLNSLGVRVDTIQKDDVETLFFGSQGQKSANMDLGGDEESFYRVEDMGARYENYEDRAYVYGTRGTSNFASEVNGRLSVWLKKTFAFRTTPICAGIYKSFDNRLYPEIAWGLRYKVPDPANPEQLSSFWKQTTTESGETVYENSLATGFDLWYDTVLPYEDWKKLGFAQKDVALLETAAVEGTLSRDYPSIEAGTGVVELISDPGDAQVSGGRWTETGTLRVNRQATLAFPVEPAGEEGEYLLSLWIKETSGMDRFSMTANGLTTEKFADRMESESLNYPLNTFAFHYNGTEKELTLTLSQGEYEIKDFSICFVDDQQAEPLVLARNRYNLSDLHVEGSRISGRIQNDTPGILALSMPYREGWICKVDGEKRPLLIVNGIFAGVELEPGTHTLSLIYTPPYLVAGAGVSALTLVGLALGGLIKRRKQAKPL